jgi:hypothetical protein
MKRYRIFFAVVLFIMGFNLYAITSLLPAADELPGWLPGGKPEHVVGEDLFLLINGGAEIYYEYGFKQAVTEVYKKGNKTINLEIYEMKSPASAYGVYTFKTGDDGNEFAIGNGAKLEDYYLNSWKGNFQVTLTGFDSGKETLNGLLTIARVIESKIEGRGVRPALPGLLLKENLNQSAVKYLRGNLALFNNYEFAAKNIFALKEGVIGTYGDTRIFIFKYESRIKSRQCFKKAVVYLKKSPAFKDFVLYRDACSLTDRKGKRLYIEQYNNYILIVLGKEKQEAESILRKMTAAWQK